MRSPNLSSGCLGLPQDPTFLPCALSEILRGRSSSASAPESASLILLCTKVLIYLLAQLLPKLPLWLLNSLLFSVTA